MMKMSLPMVDSFYILTELYLKYRRSHHEGESIV